MTDEELIARQAELLRRMSPRLDIIECEYVLKAADYLEQLVKERDELGRKLNTARYGQPDFAWSIHEQEMADLRFKLAKAVEALREIEADCDADYPLSHGAIKHAIRTTLAELEGK